jgi:Cu(I)/Ag(I) efflux system membrane fusion protein
MKTFLPIVIALIFGVIVGAFTFRGSGESHGHSSLEEKKPGSGIWTCSMHPQVQAPKPGKCPICAMDLIPQSQMGGGGEGREFSMSEASRILAEIETTGVVRRYPEAKIQLYGTAMYDETSQKTIAARFPGRIERLFVDFTGIRVQAGDHLATIYSPELLAAQSELLSAIRFNSPDTIRIARDKLRLWGFTDSRITEIEKSGTTSDQLIIDAPVSGIVTSKNVSEGDYVETGMPLFQINHLDELWVMFDAYESDKPWLRFGQKISFTAEALPGKKFEGRISFISPELDPKTRTFNVRVNFPNGDEMLKPGMFLRGVVTSTVAGNGRVIDEYLIGKWISPMHPEIVKDAPGKCDICGMDLVPAEELGYHAVRPDGKPPLVVPVSAVLNTGKRSVVYVEKPGAKEPTYEGREILLGARADDVYLVEAGLSEGEKVVTEGAFVIDSALQIQARPSMMLPSDEAAPLYRKFEAGNEFLTGVDAVVREYFKVQAGLAGDDLSKAKSAAVELGKALDEVPFPLLEKDAATVWGDLRNQIASAMDDLTAASGIEQARVSFEPLSVGFDQLVRQFGTGDLSVYEAHCPMAFDGRGANWLQETEKLINPYFGSAMLNCGEITGQLSGAAVAVPAVDAEEEKGETAK